MSRLSILLFGLAAMASAMPSNRIFDGEDPSNIHAVLFSTVSSTDGEWWLNYAAEAEVARTFHLLIDHGVPTDNIIVFMNGDFVNNTQNPFPGKLFTDIDRRRNYAEGLKVDYSGAEVNPANYLAVLRGEADKVKGGSGRVLKSNEKNRVFISHESHGGVGYLFISDQGHLTAKDLNEALNHASEKKMFKELIYYIMACRSGSMFKGIMNETINIYAMTAAQPNTDTNGKDVMKGEEGGKKYKLCVNTQFGDAWMDNSEQCNSQSETLIQQYDAVVPQVASGPMHFGNMEIAKEPIGNFEGKNEKSAKCPPSNTKVVPNKGGLPIAPIAEYLYLKQQQQKNSANFEEQALINQKLAKMEAERAQINAKINAMIASFVDEANFDAVSQKLRQTPDAITKLDCHDEAIKAVWNECKEIRNSAFISDFVTPIASMCEHGFDAKKIVEQIKVQCH